MKLIPKNTLFCYEDERQCKYLTYKYDKKHHSRKMYCKYLKTFINKNRVKECDND